MIYDRETKEAAPEKVYEDKTMRVLYNTVLGGLCVLFLRLPVVSMVYGLFQKSKRSINKIKATVENYGIDMSGFQDRFTSFNDFIIRKRLQTDFSAENNHLIAPADGCVRAFTIENGSIFTIKGRSYTLSQFIKDETLAAGYEGGCFLIFRLRVYDYHRFCFIDNGIVLSHKRISGFLDSVNMSATCRFTLSSNCREITHMQTENFGNVVCAEVGAMLVGRIVQTYENAKFRKGDEKGYFEFGGSSIVIILKKDVAQIDDDILNCSAKGMETKVRFGERIGIKRV